MPEANAAPAQAEEGGGGQSMTTRLIQGVAMYIGIQLLMRQFMPKPAAQEEIKDDAGNIVKVPANNGDIPQYLLRPKELDEGATYSQIPQRIAPIWAEDSKVDVLITVSPSLIPNARSDPVVMDEKNFGVGNWSDSRSVDLSIDVPRSVQRNATLFGHFFIGLAGSVLDTSDPKYDPASAYHFVFPLTQYIAKKKEVKAKKLLESKGDDEPEVVEQPHSGPIVGNYYHPNQTLSFIPNTGELNFEQVGPAARQFLRLEATGARDGTGRNSWYYPILFVNTFWQLKSHMTQLNETVKTVPLHIDLGHLANWKFQLMANTEANSRESARQAAYGGSVPGGGDGSEMEMIKEVLLDTNPILLAITTIVTIAHLILETLAFGSDIAHYRKKKDNVGISVRSILGNVFMQTVILLYLVDNSQNTSWMILGSQAVGILIEFWKITTVVNVRVRDAAPGSIIPYRIAFEDKHTLSETEEKTKEYDEIAFKYMYMVGAPLLIAYAIYSVMYESHKSWYSYIIATLVGSVYAYGFLMMVPSLYINYRLKSVAHMPAKAMMYKFLNTFIDDLFAFTIKMPFLHRLATLRDDVIFFVYLYQRWAYKIDYTRVNEFGQGGDEEPEKEKKAEGQSLPAEILSPEKSSAVAKDIAKASGAQTKGATKRR